GTHEPTTGTPARRPGSVRRTTTTDSLRPNGINERFILAGTGRDLVTHLDGAAEVVNRATTRVELAYEGGAIVKHIESSPVIDNLSALVGKRATTGFRAVIDDDTAAQRGELVYLLLEEIPVSTLVSGYSVGNAIRRGDADADALAKVRNPGPPIHGRDDCAGFRVGSVIDTSGVERGSAVTGPDATEVTNPDDPLGWHELTELPPDAMRRWRRHDLWRGDDGQLHIDSFFRDSHMAPEGLETIIHEYTVEATIDPSTFVVTSCVATPRVLPWQECPEAAASAGRLVGLKVETLRTQLRAEMVGPSTCTHLRDQLRELEDAIALARLLPPG
ncbi:MAG: DUF2889 domain-containing protein, partial [Acidimicrobiia bacterium]